jgi:anti-sigma factor ChrR (cupin superfamily)
MHISADFSQPATVRPGEREWVPSPMAGVTRLMLDRIGEEVARATSLVRYEPHSLFPRHVHGGGEEIMVLEGEFADEHGTYPAGSYLRNPVGTSHAPRVGAGGSLLFVKLHQFDARDQRQCAIDTRLPAWLPTRAQGVSVMPLHDFDGEQVRLLKLGPASCLAPHAAKAGEEWLVLDGEIRVDSVLYPRHSWLRWPAGSVPAVAAGPGGALLYSKTGHLGKVEGPA